MGWTRSLAVNLPLAIFWFSGVLYAGIANALTLAPIAVRSYLGQNLVAEIEVVNLMPQEELSLKARIADPNTFFKLSMDYNPSIGDLHIELLRRPDGTRLIKLRSARPIAEPFVDLVIEVSSSATHLIRPYRLLLDLPPLDDGLVPAPDRAERSAPASTPALGAVLTLEATALPPVSKNQLAGAQTKKRPAENLEKPPNEAKRIQELNAPSPTDTQTTAIAAAAPITAPFQNTSQAGARPTSKTSEKVVSSPAPLGAEANLLGLVPETLSDSLGVLLIGLGALGMGIGAVFLTRKRKLRQTQAPAPVAAENHLARWTMNTEANSAAYAGGPVAIRVSNGQMQAQDTILATELDTLAEADVYLAYGKDEPAEEILREGLAQDPKRVAIHLKLAEIYVARQDTIKFAICANQVQALVGSESTAWAQIQALGQSMEPDNPRYQNTAGIGLPPTKASAAPDIDPVLSFTGVGEGVASGAKAQVSDPMSFDLDALSLDLAASPSSQTKSFSEQLDTSMELAKKIIEIGELQGARSLLDEVIAKGSDEQRKKALTMMANLK
jgi:pilus assembly protein FimV